MAADRAPVEAPRAVISLLLVAIGLAVLQNLTAELATRSAGTLPDTVTLYVAVPADEEIDYLIADAALHEAELAMAWVEAQTGRTFRRGPGFARVLQVAGSAESYRGSARAAAERVIEDVHAQAGRDDTFPLVMADLRTDADDARLLTCGLGGPGGIVMFIDNCPGHRPSTGSTWGSGASRTIAHELLHGLGAVRDCAPNHGSDGHVLDDPRDILAPQLDPDLPAESIRLDAARDDYFDHDIPGCADIADSPLWQ